MFVLCRACCTYFTCAHRPSWGLLLGKRQVDNNRCSPSLLSWAFVPGCLRVCPVILVSVWRSIRLVFFGRSICLLSCGFRVSACLMLVDVMHVTNLFPSSSTDFMSISPLVRSLPQVNVADDVWPTDLKESSLVDI